MELTRGRLLGAVPNEKDVVAAGAGLAGTGASSLARNVQNVVGGDGEMSAKIHHVITRSPPVVSRIKRVFRFLQGTLSGPDSVSWCDLSYI